MSREKTQSKAARLFRVYTDRFMVAISEKCRKIDFLKVDVEGHELDVLEGGKSMFTKNAIDAVQFEFGGCNIDTRTFFVDFWRFFGSRSFKIFRILPDNLLSIEAYAENLERFECANYLAVNRDSRLIDSTIKMAMQ